MDEKKEISREAQVKSELYEKRKNLPVGDFEKLCEYLKLCETYDDDYGGVVMAMGQAALAVMDYFAHVFGITGFQASCLNFEILRGWTYSHNKTSLKIVDYDDMLYPQFSYKYDKTITPYIWESIQKEAKRSLDEMDSFDHKVHPAVIAHWQSIVDGVIPFGYTIADR